MEGEWNIRSLPVKCLCAAPQWVSAELLLHFPWDCFSPRLIDGSWSDPFVLMEFQLWSFLETKLHTDTHVQTWTGTQTGRHTHRHVSTEGICKAFTLPPSAICHLQNNVPDWITIKQKKPSMTRERTSVVLDCKSIMASSLCVLQTRSLNQTFSEWKRF